MTHPEDANLANDNFALREGGPGRVWIQSILDAGGEVDAVLSGLLYRRIALLDVGQILEVISRDPRNHDEICNWCDRTGHVLQGVAQEKSETIFWIRKTG